MGLNQINASNGSGEAVKASVISLRSPGSTSLSVDDLTNWPAHFIATSGAELSDQTLDPATIMVFKGHITGSLITIDSIAPGYADTRGNSVNDIVILKPSTLWADNIAAVMGNSLDDDGTLKDDSVTTTSITDLSVTKGKLEKAHYNMQYFAAPATGQVIGASQVSMNWSAADATNGNGITPVNGSSGYMLIARDGLYNINFQIQVIDVDSNGFAAWFYYILPASGGGFAARFAPQNIPVNQGTQYNAQLWLTAGTKVHAEVFSASGSTRLGGDSYGGTRLTIAEIR